MDLTQQASTWIEDPQLSRRIMNFAIAYAYIVKQILRREPINTEDLEGLVDAAEVMYVLKREQTASGVAVCLPDTSHL